MTISSSAHAANDAAAPTALGRNGLANLLYATVGTAFFWEMLRYKTPASVFPTSGVPFVAYSLATLACIAALALCATSRPAHTVCGRGAPLTAVICACLFGVASAQACLEWPVPIAIQIVLAAACGVGTGATLTAWFDRLARIRAVSDVPLVSVLLASQLLSLVLGMALFSLSPAPWALAFVAPAGVGLCCKLFDAGTGPFEEPVSREPFRAASLGAPPSGTLLVMLAGVCFASGTALGLAGGENVHDYTLWLKYLASMAVIAALLVYLLDSDREFERLLVVCMALVGLVLVGLALLENRGSTTLMTLGSVAATVAKTCAELPLCLFIARDALDPATRRGNFMLFLALPSVCAPLIALCGLPWIATASGIDAARLSLTAASALTFVTVAGVIAALALMVIRAYGMERLPDWDSAGREAIDESGVVDGTNVARGADAQEPLANNAVRTGFSPPALEPATADAVQGLAREYGLTFRESQILGYAFKGYSLQRVAQMDTVSINTVKSHWKNLYRKLGVHTRQELIDLVERSAGS